MGLHTAHCMSQSLHGFVSVRSSLLLNGGFSKHISIDADSIQTSSIFDIFTHITRFFGFKVILIYEIHEFYYTQLSYCRYWHAGGAPGKI